MKMILKENQRGLLYKDGVFVKMLAPGKHRFFTNVEVVVVTTDKPLQSETTPLDTLLKNSAIGAETAVVDVKDQQMVLHFINGAYKESLLRGKFAFWKGEDEHTFTAVDLTTPEVDKDIPRYLFSKIPSTLYTRVQVEEYQKARLYYDGKFIRLLEPGTYFFWKTNIIVTADYVDIRLTQMNMQGQEMLTKDKVSLRINFVTSYRIIDYIKIVTEIDNYTDQLYTAAQMALRTFIGRYTLDELLENKEQLSAFMLENLQTKAPSLYLDVVDAGVKDIILPGEIKDIMNTVLVAEKRAQANVITRREEVASTRSLLNTAKLMDENQTLYKLKELEYLERISDKVDSIQITGSGDILSQLTGAIKGAIK